ncbi:PAS domain S-box protein [Streptomyces sp. 110]|uniref:histidine kinase n=1 Tax=Streptomyces endocoffeicus TaxID=2898945 RepID=A0ABS1PGH0_9ACTN|nr:ATP-binding protein [Streptomyces endocoffeicus]MBL1111484.1 PAS domain S-box protein [Streptomyces endocoffeicus]
MRDTAVDRLPSSGFRTLMEALKYCVLLHDARTYEILWANRAACELLGWTVDELKPLKAPDMSKNARQYSRELGHRWLGHAARHGISATEWCYRSRSGEEILTEAIAIRVVLPERAVVMVQFRDIAEEKAVRRDLSRAEEEHRRDTQRLNHLARNNAMGDMAMAIAHEVSQPLAAAYNFVEGARGRLGRGDETVAWGLDNAARQIERARRILSSLRSYVGRLEQSEQLTDLNAIVRDCAYFIELRAQEHAVPVVFDLTAEPLPVRCENILIGQVVMNLAFNAVDEMAGWPEAERTVSVTTRRGGDGSAVLEVRDAGKGPPPEDRIFDGVFTSKENGSGIGLALSHRIVARHGGRIEAGANEPRGAVFRFTLPMADPGR